MSRNSISPQTNIAALSMEAQRDANELEMQSISLRKEEIRLRTEEIDLIRKQTRSAAIAATAAAAAAIASMITIIVTIFLLSNGVKP